MILNMKEVSADPSRYLGEEEIAVQSSQDGTMFEEQHRSLHGWRKVVEDEVREVVRGARTQAI